MFIVPPLPTSNENRKGVILLVVISLLALFAAVGISFVYYAEAESLASRINRESGTARDADADPELLLSHFLSQFIYDTSNPYSSLRGHSLARNMYGYRTRFGAIASAIAVPNAADPPSPPNAQVQITTAANHGLATGDVVAINGITGVGPTLPITGAYTVTVLAPNVLRLNNLRVTMTSAYAPGSGTWYALNRGDVLNTVPYCGVGRYRNATTFDHLISNFSFFPGDPAANFRHPEMYNGQYIAGNVPWTYPDLNNFYLGAMNNAGEILMQSFRRDWAGTGRYNSLRPDPALHPFFPPRPDLGGDVKNVDSAVGVRTAIAGTFYNHDSDWMYTGFPILTAPDGRKYTALFAPFVMDLDGKINLNVAGNIRGTGNTHVSNQGIGPWEMRLNAILPTQSANLFTGALGRYGTDNQPVNSGGNLAYTPVNTPFYGRLDLDATQTTLAASPRMLLPGETGNTNPRFYPYPNYPGAAGTYGNGTGELANHPARYNYFAPGSGDRAFGPAHVEALLRYRGTGSPGLVSDLFRLCPTDFPGSNAFRKLTPISFDLGRPGATAWLPSTAAAPYTLGALPYPTGGALSTPTLAGPSPTTGEFNDSFRSFLAGLGKLNLNRTLAAYPAPDAATAVITTASNTAFRRAQAERQNFAQQIFEYLRFVTTGARPEAPLPAPGATAEYNALKWLAQLAVNIVDYIDNDTYITPFNWDTTTSGTPGAWVYGVEMPQLVINEVYSEVANDAGDLMGTMRYRVNFWVELLNPLNTDANLVDGGNVRLQLPGGSGGGNPVYRLFIGQTPAAGVSPFSDPNTGEPDTTFSPLVPPEYPAAAVLEVADYTADPAAPAPLAGVNTSIVQPVGTNYSRPLGNNQGFYVLGPAADFPGNPGNVTLRVLDQPIPPGPLRRSAMSYTIPNMAAIPTDHSLYLRRLACPHRPYDNNRLVMGAPNPDYNPYITVDYVTGVNPVANNARTFMDGAAVAPVAINLRYAHGRRQPFTAALIPQDPDSNPATAPTTAANIENYTTQPQHTFFRHNAMEHQTTVLNDPTYPRTDAELPRAPKSQTLTIPFAWPGHLDRPIVSPMELLGVSGGKAYQLTQRFPTQIPAASSYLAPWFENDARIYRFFEFVDAGWRASGVTFDGRIPGKFNINTGIWSGDGTEVLAALGDFPAGTHAGSLTTIRDDLLAHRTPLGMPSANDRPFKSLAAGVTGMTDPQSPYTAPAAPGGIDDTVLRLNNITTTGAATRRLFEAIPLQAHPVKKYDFLGKIFNNVTTRSNVFALWLTAGFFEVTDGPVATVTSTSPASPGVYAINPSAFSGNINGVPWALQPQMHVWIGGRPTQILTTPAPTATTFYVSLPSAPAVNDLIELRGVLGREVGRDENRHIRHRMFAIIDRTNLLIPQTITTTRTAVPTPTPGVPQTIQVNSLSVKLPAPAAVGLTIKPGMALEFLDPIVKNRETVVISAVNPTTPFPTITASFTRPHFPGVPIAVPVGIRTLGAITAGVDVTVPVPNLTGIKPDGTAFTIARGMSLWVDSGTTRELVRIKEVPPITPPNTFRADFANSHAASTIIYFPEVTPGPTIGTIPTIYGNPGPQTNFDPRQQTALVPYFSIIQ